MATTPPPLFLPIISLQSISVIPYHDIYVYIYSSIICQHPNCKFVPTLNYGMLEGDTVGFLPVQGRNVKI